MPNPDPEEPSLTPEATPVISIDYENETLTGFTYGDTYTANGSNIASITSGGTKSILVSWYGTTLSIVKTGDNVSTSDSAAQTLSIPTRPTAPTGLDGSDNEISGVDTTMEYQASGASDWTAVTVDPITGLTAGDYNVRYAATANGFASTNTVVTVSDTAPV